MTLKIDGQKFGRLLAVRKVGSQNKKVIWLFQCDCGRLVELPATYVARGHTSSCGCLRIERSRAAVLSDISGRIFGRLTVLGLANRSEGGRVMWTCACACGTVVDTSAKNLLNGTKASCGCRKAEAGALNIAARAVDYVDRRFGKLLVIRATSTKPYQQKRWICQCDCGQTCVIPHSSLQQGRAISCGCARRDPITYMSAKARAYGAVRWHIRRARVKQATGSFTTAEIDSLFEKQRGRCTCCGDKLSKGFHRDHIVALKNGGSNSISNIQLLCPPCHRTKGALDPMEWARKHGRLL